MKVTALAAATLLITLPAQADSSVPNCDNDGHCTVLNEAALNPSPPKIRSGAKKTIAPTQQLPSSLDANGNSNNTTETSNTTGVITSHKTGARARVSVAYAARFQAYIDDLETNHGARVLFMSGIRPGRCSSYSEHPCGKALDVCQLGRGVVDPRCNLPRSAELGQIAASHGLFEGGRWCNSDYGHAQIGVTAAPCGDRGVRIVQR